MDINKFCQNEELHNRTIVYILEGTHTLRGKCEFTGGIGLELRGTSESMVFINCSYLGDAGFVFLNASSVMISGIHFCGCGSTHNHTSQQLDGIRPVVMASLLFINGTDVHLGNISVLDAKSAGIYIYNVAGNVTITACTVTNASSNGLATMSGNVIVYDNHTHYGAEIHILNSSILQSGYRKTCNFAKTYSSGLSLFVDNPNTVIFVAGTDFSNNAGCYGGNMALLIFDHPLKNQRKGMIQITNSRFISGQGYIGGGIYISYKDSFLGYYHKSKNTDPSQTVSITGSQFISNRAESVGGGIYIQWKQSPIVDEMLDMNITDSTFNGNSIGVNGSGGMALHYKIYLDTGDEPHRLTKFRLNLDISNCTFRNHSPILSSSQLFAESSVILAKSAPYLGLHSITVTSNNCTAILALGSTLVFSGISMISENIALTGAGIRLCSSALMYLTPYTKLTITNNTAMQAGGGIRVNSNCLVNIPMCFCQYSRVVSAHSKLLTTIDVHIYNNTAPMGGDNIYGGSIDYCYLLYIHRNDSRFINQLRVPPNSIENPSSISSNPQQVCFIGPQQNSQDLPSLDCIKESHVSLHPGQNHTVSLRVVGQVKGSVSGTVLASFAGQEGSINFSDEVQTVNISGENLTYTIYSRQHDIETRKEICMNLEVDVVNDRDVNEYILRYPPAVLKINFIKCPFGFSITNVSKTNVPQYSCQCEFREIAPLEACSIDDRTIRKKNHAWVGVFSIYNKTHLATSDYCPLDYCEPAVRDIKSTPYTLDQDDQCRYNRTGVLCGSCPANWSLVLGSLECREKCSNAWLVLIIPFSLMGLFLVLVIHLLDMTVTMGTVNGLIFYANVMQDYSVTIFHEYHVPGLTPILQVFIAWFNLDLGIATCFYDRMEAFGKNFLLCVFPIYIWLISILIIFLSNRYISVTKLVGKNAVKVLATLFLLSYSKMLRVTIGTLNAKILHIHINQNTTISKLRWILDGNISYFDAHYHLGVVVMSVVFIALSLPFTIMLLCIKRVYLLSTCSRVFSWIDKLKPFFDTYTGPFKDNARFWTGLLLTTRLFLLLVHIFDFSRNKGSPSNSVVFVCFVLCALMVFLNGIYKKHRLNILECFFIFNIGLVFLSQFGIGHRVWKGVVSHALISMAFLAFIGIVTYHVYLKFPNCNCSSLWRRPAFWRRRAENFDVRSFEGMRGFEGADHETSEDDAFDASDKLANFPPLEHNLSYDNYEHSGSFSSGRRSRKY